SDSILDMGPAAGRTCFLSGIAGNLTPGYGSDGAYHEPAVGVYSGADGHYHLAVYTVPGHPLGGFARCVNTTNVAGNEATFFGPIYDEVVLAPADHPGRQCFLTTLLNTPPEAPGGAPGNAFSVKVYNNGTNWVMGGQSSKTLLYAAALCFDVN